MHGGSSEACVHVSVLARVVGLCMKAFVVVVIRLARSRGKAAAINAFIDPGFKWEDLTWLRSITKLPIYLKGTPQLTCLLSGGFFAGSSGVGS